MIKSTAVYGIFDFNAGIKLISPIPVARGGKENGEKFKGMKRNVETEDGEKE